MLTRPGGRSMRPLIKEKLRIHQTWQQKHLLGHVSPMSPFMTLKARQATPDTLAAEGLNQTLDDDARRATTFAEESQRHSWSGNGVSTEVKDSHVTVDTSNENDKEHMLQSSLLDQHIYYDKIIMQVQELSRKAVELRKEIDADRADRAGLDMLKSNAEQANCKAQELEKEEQEARKRSARSLDDSRPGHARLAAWTPQEERYH